MHVVMDGDGDQHLVATNAAIARTPALRELFADAWAERDEDEEEINEDNVDRIMAAEARAFEADIQLVAHPIAAAAAAAAATAVASTSAGTNDIVAQARNVIFHKFNRTQWEAAMLLVETAMIGLQSPTHDFEQVKMNLNNSMDTRRGAAQHLLRELENTERGLAPSDLQKMIFVAVMSTKVPAHHFRQHDPHKLLFLCLRSARHTGGAIITRAFWPGSWRIAPLAKV